MTRICASTRARVYKRDKLKCQYCWCKCIIPTPDDPTSVWAPNRATVDHVVPKSKGGSNRIDNLVTACARCNTAKGNRAWPGMPKKWPPTLADIAPELHEALERLEAQGTP